MVAIIWSLIPPLIYACSDLGTGKTCLARGLIRAAAEDDDVAVTSPSYLLDNAYDAYDPWTETEFV